MSKPQGSNPIRNYLSGLHRDVISEYFAAAVDIRNALALRKSVITIEIGRLLGELSETFVRFDKDTSVVQAIDGEIRAMKEAVRQNGVDINFIALEYSRSTHKPELGQSFYEKHRFLVPDIQEYVQTHDNASAAAKQFFDDPFSLQEHRLSRFFSLRG